MQVEKLNKDISSRLLIVFVIITFITNISITLIQGFVDNWLTSQTMIVIQIVLQAIRNISYILPALAIKNRTYKIIGIILTSMMIVYMLCNTIIKMSTFN